MKKDKTTVMFFSNQSSQKGVALITVLFLFALATVIISGLFILQQINIQRASAILESEQASLLTLSGEEWARQLLAEDYKINPDIDHLHEKWALNGNIIELENGYIEILINDAQGKFNLNNLAASTSANPGAGNTFQRLLDFALNDGQLSTTIANQAVDWLDPDNNGIEEMDYLSEPLPYRPPNTTITDVSELRWLKDVDRNVYRVIHQEVLPSIVALPAQTKVNINSVTPPVLAAMANLNISEAENIVSGIRSNENGYPTADAATNVQQVMAVSQSFGGYSEYFEVKVRARFADHYAFLTSVIFRDHQNDGKMTVISRDRSERFIFPFSKDYDASRNSKDYEIDI